MAIEITITPRGLFPRALEEGDLCLRGLQMGHWNQAGVLDEGPAPDGRVLCDPARLGRGCFLRALPGEKKQVHLRQPVPCTMSDLEVLYDTAAALCRVWKTDRFQQDGETVLLRDLDEVKRRVAEQGLALLHAAAERWAADGLALLPAARYPIYMEPEVLPRFTAAENLDFFGAYLHRKQNIHSYYAKPAFYRHSNGTDVLGVYTLTEGVDSILPRSPFVPPLYYATLKNFSLEDGQVTQWQVSLVQVREENGQLSGSVAGSISFAALARLTGLEHLPPFDQRHVRIRLDDVTALCQAAQAL